MLSSEVMIVLVVVACLAVVPVANSWPQDDKQSVVGLTDRLTGDDDDDQLAERSEFLSTRSLQKLELPKNGKA